MLEYVLLVEFILCVCTWSFLGSLLIGSASDKFHHYGDPSITAYLEVAQTMVGLAFGILMAFFLPAVASWAYVRSSRKFRRDSVFPRSSFYIGLFMIFSVVKMFVLAISLIFGFFNLNDQNQALARQAYTVEFLKMSDIQDSIDVLVLFIAFASVWIAYLLASLFGACYVLGAQHGRGKTGK